MEENVNTLFADNIKGNVTVGSGAVLNIDPAARIIVECGSLFLNSKWAKNDPFPFMLTMKQGATLIVKKSFFIYSGARIYINEGATLILGGGYINHDLNLSCFSKIEIGEGAAISERVCIRDSDNHCIGESGKPPTQPINIGQHVWIGMNTTILKGVHVGDGTILAAGSVVNKDIPAYSLAAGVPAKIKKTGVEWR